MKETYLVQRIEKRDEIRKDKGVDSYFRMDYMGSAEFEFGAIPTSLKQMRLSKLIGPSRTKVGKHVAWYVGPDDGVAIAAAFFRDQLRHLRDRKTRLKEPSYLATVYGVEDTFTSTHPNLVGWWDVINNWVIFTTKEYAEQWLAGLANKPKPEKE